MDSTKGGKPYRQGHMQEYVIGAHCIHAYLYSLLQTHKKVQGQSIAGDSNIGSYRAMYSSNKLASDGPFVVQVVSNCTGCTVQVIWYACSDLSRQQVTSLSVLQALAGACDMFTGAELAGLCREAAITALREDLQVQDTHLLLT